MDRSVVRFPSPSLRPCENRKRKALFYSASAANGNMTYLKAIVASFCGFEISGRVAKMPPVWPHCLLGSHVHQLGIERRETRQRLLVPSGVLGRERASTQLVELRGIARRPGGSGGSVAKLWGVFVVSSGHQ